MPRLNIEDNAFADPRIHRMARELGITFAYAMGNLALLWHESQAEKVVEATTDQIILWGDFLGDPDFVIQTMQKAGLIRPASDGRWIIRGNSVQISGLKDFSTSQSKKAKHRWDEIKKSNKKPDLMPDHAESCQTMPDPCQTMPKMPNSNSNSNFNFKLGQEKNLIFADVGADATATVVAKKKKTDEAKKARNAKTWELYESRFRAKYQTAPLRGVVINAQIAKLTDQIPGDDMPGVIDAFFADTDAYVSKSGFPVGLLLQRAQAYLTRFKAAGAAVVSAKEETDRMPDEYFWEREDELDYRGWPDDRKDEFKKNRIEKRRSEGWRSR